MEIEVNDNGGSGETAETVEETAEAVADAVGEVAEAIADVAETVAESIVEAVTELAETETETEPETVGVMLPHTHPEYATHEEVRAIAESAVSDHMAALATLAEPDEGELTVVEPDVSEEEHRSFLHRVW